MTVSNRQLERYPKYLIYLKQLQEQNQEYISSREMAEIFNCSQEQIRKDFQAISTSKGKPRFGRSISTMIDDLENFLEYRNSKQAIIVGVGQLASAILGYDGFSKYGLKIIAGFDINPNKVGKTINGKPIYHIDELEKIIKKTKVNIAIITTDKDSGQEIADRLIKSGIKGIWNFAPIHLEVSDDIAEENVDLAASLAVLSHKLKDKESM